MMKAICVSPTRALHAALRCGKLGSEDICCVSFEMQQGLYALRFRSDWLLYDSYVDACSGEELRQEPVRELQPPAGRGHTGQSSVGKEKKKSASFREADFFYFCRCRKIILICEK